MKDVEVAQEVLDRILKLLPGHTTPLRQMNPGEDGIRSFNLGHYNFKVVRSVPRFFSLINPFGSVREVIAQNRATLNHFLREGQVFVLNREQEGDEWTIIPDKCRELLTFLRTEMVLSDLAGVRDHMLSLREL